ncbi:MAG: type IX secretion system sortase PorU [Paludibacter sp.]|nr:type IX secretion system sortase PorU [Paludibacter sp.]
MKIKNALLFCLVFLNSFIMSAQESMIDSDHLNQSTSGTLHSYVANSVLSQGTFYKIKIIDTGVYKLTFEDLTSMGIDPENVRIFGYGGALLEQNFSLSMIDDLPETAIWMEKGTDGVFNAGDYILFYAQGTTRWSYNTNKSMFTHIGNSYSNAGYYFVTSDAGTGKKIQDKPIELPADPTINPVTEFTDYQVHERDLINFVSAGKEFYGETFNSGNNHKFIFNFPNPVLTENAVKVNLDVAATSPSTSSFIINLNASQHKTLTVAPQNSYDPYERAKRTAGIFTFTSQNDLFEFNLTYSMPAPASIGYLNYLEVNARRQLTMSGSVMQFQNVDYLGLNSYNQYMLSSDNQQVQIWDITDQQHINKIITEDIGGKMSFVDDGNDVKHYLAIDPTAASAFPTPEIIGAIPNQNIHAIPQTDMVIITHSDFLTQAETLAQAHRQKDNMTVTVVTTEQVYNEFSSGTPDATAYRRIMKMFYDRSTTSGNTADLPKYLLLFGRGSFDNRKILADSGDNLILTYQADNSLIETLAYTTDDYFTFLEDSEGLQVPVHSMDIAVGRFPVTTVQQATDVVNKTINYMNNTGRGKWKSELCFLGDDRDYNTHMKMADSIASYMNNKHKSYRTNKIYFDAFKKDSTEIEGRYPSAKDSLLHALQKGLFLLNYTGHGSSQFWANEQILTNTDITGLTNEHLPLWIGATSEFVRFDKEAVSAGENALLNPVGGGIGVFSAARLSYASQNFNLNNTLIQHLFKKENGQHLRIGEAIRKVKNNLGPEINKLAFIYLGDPAIKLNYADYYQISTNKINENSSFGNDTLKANTTNTIQGSIVDDNFNKITDFNGTLQLSLYGKSQTINTLRNSNFFNEPAFVYNDRPIVLFSGEVPVVNGEFSYTFVMPKDIDEDYGIGRINYYAQDDTNDFEAQGYFEEFIVGGTDNTADITPPNANDLSSEIKVTNYPNPASDQMYFAINHFDNIVSCSIDIFDVSGRNICTISSTAQDKIFWDLTSNNGQKIIAGIYFYRAKIKTTDKEIYTTANRIVITD